MLETRLFENLALFGINKSRFFLLWRIPYLVLVLPEGRWLLVNARPVEGESGDGVFGLGIVLHLFTVILVGRRRRGLWGGGEPSSDPAPATVAAAAVGSAAVRLRAEGAPGSAVAAGGGGAVGAGEFIAAGSGGGAHEARSGRADQASGSRKRQIFVG